MKISRLPVLGYNAMDKRLMVSLAFLIGLLICNNNVFAQTNGFTNYFNYNDGTTYDRSRSANDHGHSEYWSNSNDSKIYDNNLRIEFDKDRIGANCGITSKTFINGDGTYSLEYRVKFDNGFEFVKGGKLPGLAGGSAPTGGGKPTDGKGFSTRYMWRQNGRLVIYAYYRDQNNFYGDDWETGVTFNRGQWYTLKQTVKVNTGNNYNGSVEVWVDGVKKLTKTGLRLMTSGNSVNRVLFDTFMGGNDDSWSPSKTQYLRLDNFVCTKGGDSSSPAPDPEPDPAPSGDTGTITVRAKGNNGTEKFELLRNDSRTGSVKTVTTSYANYTFEVPTGSANYKVKYFNDISGRDLYVDYIKINGSNIQAEAQSDNTGSWNAGEGRCGGVKSQKLSCNGRINFGSRTVNKDGGSDPEPDPAPAPSGDDGTITVRARGNDGSERFELLRNDGRTGSVKTVTTSWANYTFEVPTGSANYKVKYLNDASGKDLYIDYIKINGTNIQAEAQSDNTASWNAGESRCGGVKSQKMSCNGRINFGSRTVNADGGSSDGTLVVRTRGTNGKEKFELLRNDARVGSVKTATTSFANYSFTVPNGSATYKVKYFNDGEGGDLRVDYIKINGTTIQAEAQNDNTGAWNAGESRCGGVKSEWLHCNGRINFGSRNVRRGINLNDELSTITVYPNPVSNTSALTISSDLEDYTFQLFDIQGKMVINKANLSKVEQITLNGIEKGLFTAIITTSSSDPRIMKLLVK